MFQRIEGDAAGLLGGIIAEMAGDIPMGCFMQRDRDDHRYGVDRHIQERIHPSSLAAYARSMAWLFSSASEQ